MVHKTVAEIAALLGRNQLPQRHLDTLRILDPVHKADPIDKPNAMRVRHNRRLAEHISHDEVRALAAHAGKLQKLVKVIRHMSAVLVAQHFHTCADIARFAPAESAGTHNAFHVVLLRRGKRLDRGVFRIQILHHHVHAGVGALGGQPHADKQLPRLIVIERAVGVRIFLFQSLNGGKRQLLFCHASSSLSKNGFCFIIPLCALFGKGNASTVKNGWRGTGFGFGV